MLKTKTIRLSNLDTLCRDHIIKHYYTVEYWGFYPESNLNGESMAMIFFKKINAEIKFPYEQNKYLIPRLKRLLCNALIQPYFD